MKDQGKLLEAQRLNARTRFDIEMMLEVGYCPGIENYSRPLLGPAAGLDAQHAVQFLSRRFPAVRRRVARHGAAGAGMYAGDYSRKSTLVEHGFRLPSALDNRPLQFDEWETKDPPGRVRLGHAGPIRIAADRRRSGRAGDPAHRAVGPGDRNHARPAARCRIWSGQIRERAAAGERVLVTALTKRLAEDLSYYLTEQGVKCKWLHSELDAFERVELLRELREGHFEALVGVNLLARRAGPARGLDGGDSRCRQGGLSAQRDVVDADHRPRGPQRQCQSHSVRRQGDRIDAEGPSTRPMRRRALQEAYNLEHGITPETIRKGIRPASSRKPTAHAEANRAVGRSDEAEYITEEYIQELEAEMLAAAESLEFERAAAHSRSHFATAQTRSAKKRDEVEIHATRGNRGTARSARGRPDACRVPSDHKHAYAVRHSGAAAQTVVSGWTFLRRFFSGNRDVAHTLHQNAVAGQKGGIPAAPDFL